ncbi:MAG: 3-deoxy-7-phosphoheptulonate synthase [Pseudomonadota bacterium]|nr:MAG: 3-deoxy-7-phosphoheptulonate synthase [Pseudomonadota bacterium]
MIGRHADDDRARGFTYNGIRFDQNTLHLFAGLCAVDNRENVESMMRALKQHQLPCTRMGAYKPRTSPYSFQGHGTAACPGYSSWRVVTTSKSSPWRSRTIPRSRDSRNTEFLRTPHWGHAPDRHEKHPEFRASQGRGPSAELPVLIKRGFGITLEESLNATEYLANEGNSNVVFCLRGMKTNLGDPHRNLVDFSHVPTVKHLTPLPVCIDPSHSVGSRNRGVDGLLDIMHVTAQGIIAGANMVLVDFHPNPQQALVDGPQAMLLDELPWFLEDMQIARQAWEKRVALAQENLKTP